MEHNIEITRTTEYVRVLREEPLGAKFVSEGELVGEVENIIRQAQRKLVLVSPFNYHSQWGRLADDIASKGLDKNVDVTIYYNPHPPGADQANPADPYEGVTGVPVENLHAKIYANETKALVTSMNLQDRSALNSREAGILVLDPNLLQQIHDYISSLTAATVEGSVVKDLTDFGSLPQPQGGKTAFCIACGAKKEFDFSRPFCPTGGHAFASAAGEYCHGCRRETKTALNAPLCSDCVSAKGYGYCIACSNQKEFNPRQPFCRFGGHNFAYAVGQYCHKCGNKTQTNRDNPLCPDCRDAGQPAHV